VPGARVTVQAGKCQLTLSNMDCRTRSDAATAGSAGFDLDPGEGATIVECARVAEQLYDGLVDDGLTPIAKTSGSKGMQVYCGVRTRQPERTSAYAKALAERPARETPELVVAKTTVAPYSLRDRDHPTESTPITWDEVRACHRAQELVFTADDVLDRVEQLGDLFADVASTRAALPAR
jgi:bifunctional non-homologous end joining protein LigD